ncbi:TRAP transporter small permease [bacterium LRH843]|nr:TRAP transporter small permease [bacterium LRH843]
MQFSKLKEYTFKSITGVSNLFLVLLTIVVTLEVISRKVFGYSFTFTSALTAVLFPWLVFLAIISVTRNNDHIGVQFFVDQLKGRMKKAVLIFNKAVMLIFSLFMLISSYELTESVISIIFPILNISKSWLYVSMVLSFLGTSIVLIFQIISLVNGDHKGGDSNDLGHGV